MNTFVKNMLSRFNYNSKMYEFENMIQGLRAAQRLPRNQTSKPAASYGWRGTPRELILHKPIPAPTIDQIRKLEQTYKCKLTVKRGLIFFRNTDIPFTHNRGKEYLHAITKEETE